MRTDDRWFREGAGDGVTLGSGPVTETSEKYSQIFTLTSARVDRCRRVARGCDEQEGMQ